MMWVDLVTAGKFAQQWRKPCIQDQNMTCKCAPAECCDANQQSIQNLGQDSQADQLYVADETFLLRIKSISQSSNQLEAYAKSSMMCM